MRTLEWILLESPAALSAIAGLTCFYLLVRWRRGGSAWPLLAALVTGGGLLVVQSLVTTRTETARAIITEIERDVIAGRTDVLARYLATDFRTMRYDKPAFLALVREQLRRVEFQSVTRTELTLAESNRAGFAVDVRYVIAMTVDTYPMRTGFARRVWFTRAGDGWIITRTEPIHPDGPDPAHWGE